MVVASQQLLMQSKIHRNCRKEVFPCFFFSKSGGWGRGWWDSSMRRKSAFWTNLDKAWCDRYIRRWLLTSWKFFSPCGLRLIKYKCGYPDKIVPFTFFNIQYLRSLHSAKRILVRLNATQVHSRLHCFRITSSTLQRKSHLCIPRKGIARSHSCVCERFIGFPGSVHICSCSRISRPIVGIYQSLTDTWKWKLVLRPRNSFSGNIFFEFSVLCLCSALPRQC